MLCLTNARQRLYTWFHKLLRTMPSFVSWNAIIDCSLYQPMSHALHYLTTAASEAQSLETVLDRLEVAWIWLNKHPDPPPPNTNISSSKQRIHRISQPGSLSSNAQYKSPIVLLINPRMPLLRTPNVLTLAATNKLRITKGS